MTNQSYKERVQVQILEAQRTLQRLKDHYDLLDAHEEFLEDESDAAHQFVNSKLNEISDFIFREGECAPENIAKHK